MKKAVLSSLTVYFLFLVSGRTPADTLGGRVFPESGEKSFVLGAASGWGLFYPRPGLTELGSLRPYPVLALSSSGNSPGFSGEAPDLSLSFDEGEPGYFRDASGHYGVLAGPSLRGAGPGWARAGAGAAQFGGGESGERPLELVPGRGALFSPGSSIRDFSIEFWLYPLNLENGEQILAWSSSRAAPGGGYISQRISCTASKNRLLWGFENFFLSPGEEGGLNRSFSGTSLLAPGTWSHHLIRFDGDRGLLEYLVNGALEALTHTTASGREGGEVYTPRIGEAGSFVLGGRFTGLLDEFRVHRRPAQVAGLGKYPPEGGRAESRFIDLGEGNSSILRLEASGGRASIAGRETRNEYTGNGDFRFRDEAAIQFFIRAAESPYHWTDADWRPVLPGRGLPPEIRGRYVQVAADFYPSGNGESTPYLEELRIVYRSDDPPFPPSLVSAIPRDGAVELSWKPSPERDVEGYLVYFGLAPGEYFGDRSSGEGSPIDAGNRNSLRVEGLKNGTLYYFAVAAYDRKDPYHPGEFSREVTARPLRAMEER
jgi:hypothetical protein